MKNYPKTTKFCLVVLRFMLSTMISYAQCEPAYNWAVWSDTAFHNTSAVDNITYRNHVVDVYVWISRYRKNGQVMALKGTVTLFH